MCQRRHEGRGSVVQFADVVGRREHVDERTRCAGQAAVDIDDVVTEADSLFIGQESGGG